MPHEKSSLTVGEILDALASVPREATVVTEGCDCFGDIGRVEFKPQDFDTRDGIIAGPVAVMWRSRQFDHDDHDDHEEETTPEPSF